FDFNTIKALVKPVDQCFRFLEQLCNLHKALAPSVSGEPHATDTCFGEKASRVVRLLHCQVRPAIACGLQWQYLEHGGIRDAVALDRLYQSSETSPPLIPRRIRLW